MTPHIDTLRAAMLHLDGRNADGAVERNAEGPNRLDTPKVRSLSSAVANGQPWTPGQAGLAWRISARYRRQLSAAGISIPDCTDDDVERLVLDVQTAQFGAQKIDGEWGLDWSQPRAIETRRGPMKMRKAHLPYGTGFWQVWKDEKDRLKPLGYSVTKDERDGRWYAIQWIATEQTKPRNEAPPAAAMRDLDSLPPVAPDIAALLLPWQVDSVRRIVASLKSWSVCADLSDVGTGKTYSSLAACRQLGLRPLVIAPLAVLPSWRKAAAHFGIDVEAINYESVRTGNNGWGRWVTSGTREYWEWSLGDRNCLIFDEVHRCKGQSSQNSQLLVAARKASANVIALSATAAVSPVDMRALGYVLRLFSTPSEHWTWAQKNGCRKGRFGGLQFSGGQAALRAVHSSMSDRMTRVRVADLGDAFPETLITVDTIDIGAAAARQVDEAYAAAAEARQKVEEKRADDGASHLTEMLRARQLSEAAKVPAIVSQTLDAVEQGMSVAVFVSFSETIAAIRKGIGKSAKVVEIHGQQTAAERQASIEAFQSDSSEVVICNIEAGGVGISLHDVSGVRPRLSIISPTWSATSMVQSLGRIHRAGGKSKSIQRIVYAAGTVEERVAKVVNEKIRNLQTLNDGDLAT